MDSHFYIEYKVGHPVTDEIFVTKSRDEAIAYFEEGWIITERHITVSLPLDGTSTRLEVSTTWTEKNNY